MKREVGADHLDSRRTVDVLRDRGNALGVVVAVAERSAGHRPP